MGNPNVFQQKVEKEISALKINEKPKEKGSKTKEEFEKEREKYKKLIEKLEEFKKKLKEIMPKYAADSKITKEEEAQIFKSMPIKLLEDLAVKSPSQLMQQVGVYSIPEQQKYMEYENILHNNPKDLFKNAEKFKDEPWAFELLMTALIQQPVKNASILFENCKKIINKDWSHSLLSIAVSFDPSAAIIHAMNYKEHKEAESILKMAATLKPDEALNNYEKYREMGGYAGDVLKNAFLMNPETAFKNYKKMAKFFIWLIERHNLSEKIKETELIKTLFIKYFNDYQEEQWAKKLIIELAEDKPRDVYKYYKNIANNDIKKQILKIAVYYSPFSAVENIDELKITNEGIEALILAFKIEPSLLNFSYDKIKNLHFTKKIIEACHLMLDEKNLGDIYKDFPDLRKERMQNTVKPMDQEYQHYLDAFKDDPGKFFLHIKDFLQKPWAQNLALNAALTSPELAFKYYQDYSSQNWAENILLNATIQAPKGIFKYKIENLKCLKLAISLAPDASINYFWANRDIFKKLINSDNKLIKNLFLSLSPATYLSTEIESLMSDIPINEFTKNILEIYNDKKKQILNIVKTILPLRPFDAQKLSKLSVQKREMVMQFIERERTEHIAKLLQDSALKNILNIADEWLIPKPNTEKLLIKYKVLICRNLYFEKKSVTKENVEQTYKEILENRDQYSNVYLFKNRNVIYAAHNEKLENGQFVFGNKLALGKIKGQAANLSFIRPESNDPDLVEERKKQILSYIRNTSSPITCVLDTHAGKKAASLTASGPDKKIAISYIELGNALIERSKRFPNENPPPNLLFLGCYSTNYIRNLDRYMREKAQLPVILGDAEYEQPSYSNPRSKYGSDYLEHVLELGSSKPTTLGRVMENEFKSGSPSVFIPKGKGKIMQLVEKKQKKSNQAQA